MAGTLADNTPEPMEAFEAWLLRRVAQAAEVPATLLAELQPEIQAAKERPQAEGHAAAIWDIAEIAGIDRDDAAGILAAIEGQPTVTRELLMRRIVEAWLEGHRKAYLSEE